MCKNLLPVLEMLLVGDSYQKKNFLDQSPAPCYSRRDCFCTDLFLVAAEEPVHNEVGEEDGPLTLDVLKHGQLPRFVVEPVWVLQIPTCQ